MKTQRPPEITASHLARRAAVYIRQSSLKQVEENTGSAEYQRGQAQWALRYGWGADQIDVFDQDQGRSGSASLHCADYQRLVHSIELREIGAVFAADLKRLGREAIEWLMLLGRCRTYDTLLIIDGKVYDIRDRSDWLITALEAMLGEHENWGRRDDMQHGRLAKVAIGKAVSRSPAGYVRGPDGTWLLDPEPAVQSAVHAVFREFLKNRSLHRTVVALKNLGVNLPRRTARYGVRWAEPQIGSLQHMIKNPAYKGAYQYRRRIVDPTRERFPGGQRRVRHGTPDEIILIPNHHDPYVSPAQWDEMHAILKLHAPSRDRRNPGLGSAVLQGVVRCARHRNRSMATAYRRRKSPDMVGAHSYWCGGDYDHGGKECGHTSGGPLDTAVRDAIVARLSAPRLEIIREALVQAKTDGVGEAHLRQTALNRARQTVADLDYRYMKVDPANRLVAKDVEAKLEAAKREVQRLERITIPEPLPTGVFNEKTFDELVTLCKDLLALWNAPSTTASDHKEIVRTLVQGVFVTYRDLEKIRARIVWVDGEPDTEIKATLDRRGHRIVVELLDQKLGLRCRAGGAWCRTCPG
jgi:DNA invertase Pin-like site-specific DNA recombinase